MIIFSMVFDFIFSNPLLHHCIHIFLNYIVDCKTCIGDKASGAFLGQSCGQTDYHIFKNIVDTIMIHELFSSVGHRYHNSNEVFVRLGD